LNLDLATEIQLFSVAKENKMCSLISFNPDFAVEIVLWVLNAIPLSIAGYFLAKEIKNYFEVK